MKTELRGNASAVLKGKTQIMYNGCCSRVLHPPGLTSNTSGTHKGRSFPLCVQLFLCFFPPLLWSALITHYKDRKQSKIWAPPSNCKIDCVNSATSQAEGETKQMKKQLGAGDLFYCSGFIFLDKADFTKHFTVWNKHGTLPEGKLQVGDKDKFPAVLGEWAQSILSLKLLMRN